MTSSGADLELLSTKGFKAKISLDRGIAELIQIFTNDKNKVINNY